MAMDALVLGPSAALNKDPTSTSSVNKQSHNYVFHSNPQHFNLHAWCLGVDSSTNKASLWRWQKELLLLRGHQQGPSTSQSGPYLRNGAEKILRPFTVGYRWTKSCKPVTGKLIYKFLPKRPYLVRQRQQYVSGSSSCGTTSPRPFPSDQLSSERKEGGGGHIRYNQVFRSLIPGSRFRFTSQDVMGKVFFIISIYSVLCIKDLSRLSLISC